MRYPKAYYDACKLQDKVMSVVETPPPKELANLCKAYAALEILKLRMRMKPAPKAIDVSHLERPSRARITLASPSE